MNKSEWLNALETPFLLIDEFRFQRNIDRLYQVRKN